MNRYATFIITLAATLAASAFIVRKIEAPLTIYRHKHFRNKGID
jgi:hypothetical protein